MKAPLAVPRYPSVESAVMQARDAAYRVLQSSTLTGVSDHDTLIYKARIAAHLFNSGHPGVAVSDVTGILDTLWAGRYTSGSGNPGFGEDHTFDAFSDGTTNSSTTIYAYTTAQAALAFLDGYVISGSSTYLSHAQACVTTLLSTAEMWSFTNGSDHGLWYSNNANDHIANTSYYVLNPCALTLAAIARIKTLTGTSPDATKQGQLETLLANNHNAGGTSGAWNYIISGVSGLNDVPHHAFMVEGVVWDATADAANALSYLWSLFGPSGRFNPADTNMMGTLLMGPGDALSALALGASTPTILDEVRQLAAAITPTIDSDGVSSYANTSATGSNKTRSIVRYGFGLARYAARLLGDGSLFP